MKRVAIIAFLLASTTLANYMCAKTGADGKVEEVIVDTRRLAKMCEQ